MAFTGSRLTDRVPRHILGLPLFFAGIVEVIRPSTFCLNNVTASRDGPDGRARGDQVCSSKLLAVRLVEEACQS